MARKPTGNANGRPDKIIDWQQFEQLCVLQCTQSEIASMLKINVETLSNRVGEQYGESYPEVYKRFQESGFCSLRRNQFVLSKKNAGMAIWLGKVYLGQKDSNEQTGLADARAILAIFKELQDLKEFIRSRGIDLADVEAAQSLLHQRSAGKQDQVSTELGADPVTERPASLQDNPESPPAGDNDVLLSPPPG